MRQPMGKFRWVVVSLLFFATTINYLDRQVIGLLKDSLAKTPWERMQANDDALNFAESLRAAMERRNAKLK